MLQGRPVHGNKSVRVHAPVVRKVDKAIRWIVHNWFPDYSYPVDSAAIQRLNNRGHIFTLNIMTSLRDIISSSSFSLRGLSKGVFERRTSSGSGAFYLLTCFDATKFELLSVFVCYRDYLPLGLTYCPIIHKGHFQLTCVG